MAEYCRRNVMFQVWTPETACEWFVNGHPALPAYLKLTF